MESMSQDKLVDENVVAAADPAHEQWLSSPQRPKDAAAESNKKCEPGLNPEEVINEVLKC